MTYSNDMYVYDKRTILSIIKSLKMEWARGTVSEYLLLDDDGNVKAFGCGDALVVRVACGYCPTASLLEAFEDVERAYVRGPMSDNVALISPGVYSYQTFFDWINDDVYPTPETVEKFDSVRETFVKLIDKLAPVGFDKPFNDDVHVSHDDGNAIISFDIMKALSGIKHVPGRKAPGVHLYPKAPKSDSVFEVGLFNVEYEGGPVNKRMVAQSTDGRLTAIIAGREGSREFISTEE